MIALSARCHALPTLSLLGYVTQWIVRVAQCNTLALIWGNRWARPENNDDHKDHGTMVHALSASEVSRVSRCPRVS
jgi:hypothetical protein